jgi:hypothetical protein
MKIYKVTISRDEATFFVKDEKGNMDPDKIIDIAMDQFLEGIEPEIYCEELEASSFPAVSAYC